MSTCFRLIKKVKTTTRLLLNTCIRMIYVCMGAKCEAPCGYLVTKGKLMACTTSEGKGEGDNQQFFWNPNLFLNLFVFQWWFRDTEYKFNLLKKCTQAEWVRCNHFWMLWATSGAFTDLSVLCNILLCLLRIIVIYCNTVWYFVRYHVRIPNYCLAN